MSTQQITQQPVKPQQLDTALICLVAAAKMLGLPADTAQLRRAYVVNEKGMDSLTLMRAAKDLGLKSRLVTSSPEQLAQTPLPAIAILKNGNYVVLVQADKERIAIIDPYKDKPINVPVNNFINAWSRQVIFLTRRAGLSEVAKKFNITWFIPAIWRYKQLLVQVLFMSFLLQLFGLVTPLFTQVIIDKVLVHRSLGTLDIFVFGMVIIAVFQVIMTALRSYMFTHTTNKIDVTLSTKLFRHITALPLKYFEKWQVGDVVARVKELDTVRNFITGSALTVLLDVIFAVIYIGVMFYYSVWLSLVALLALPLYTILNIVVTPIYRQRMNDRFAAGTESQAFLIEAVTGIQTVKSLAVEPHFINKWEQLLARYVKTAFSTTNLSNISGTIGEFIQNFFNLAILWVGAHAVMENNLSVGQLIAFQMLAGQVTSPVLRLVNMWQYFQQTMVSVDRLGDLINESTEPAFNPNRTTLPNICGDIFLDRVTFRYRPDTSEVLQQVSLQIKAGSRVGIVGRSGSGKSTLTKLIQRLYVPESGRVLIDGVDLVQVEPAWLRRQIGVVLQENYLFSGSIATNIAIARPEASIEEVIQAAQIAGAHEFIQQLPGGYDANVGEGGTGLSGGQRQRIAIARALLTNPRVLIFDEATSALDYESERIIMDNLDKIAAGRTMVMIAHRLSTVRRCHVIIVLDRGRVIEVGTHEQLLAHRGYYYNMYQQQDTG
ncbi:MAG: type secretion system ATPase [Sporomusa sp.]|nr:type secretion system ATPase [Sporomusa sp.]